IVPAPLVPPSQNSGQVIRSRKCPDLGTFWWLTYRCEIKRAKKVGSARVAEAPTRSRCHPSQVQPSPRCNRATGASLVVAAASWSNTSGMYGPNPDVELPCPRGGGHAYSCEGFSDAASPGQDRSDEEQRYNLQERSWS